MILMKKISYILFLTTFLISCESKKPQESPSTWSSQMQGLAGGVREILPFIYNKNAFNDPTNKKHIEEKLKSFAGRAHSLKPQMAQKYFGADPLVNYSLEQMTDDLNRSLEAFQMGRLEYSRGVAKSVVNHCFRCHSVANVGAATYWNLQNVDSFQLSALEKLDLLVASRRFDEAIELSESLLNDNNFMKSAPFDYESVLRKYMALMVRVQKNPKKAMAQLDNILRWEDLPFYLADQMQSWRLSLNNWVKEKKRKANLLARAQLMMNHAKQSQQFQKDHGADVELLRASNDLHEFLKQPKIKARDMALAYFLLGEVYEVMDDLGYWNLHELYFESCIVKAPEALLARTCYSRLEASVYLGYSGSSGIHVPEAERQRLSKLKQQIPK